MSPWNTIEVYPKIEKELDSPYGYVLDDDELYPASEEELKKTVATREVWYVWTPEHDRYVAPSEPACLKETFRTLMLSAGKSQITFGVVSLVAYLVVLSLTNLLADSWTMISFALLFGFVVNPIINGLYLCFRYRGSGVRLDDDLHARYEYWLEGRGKALTIVLTSLIIFIYAMQRGMGFTTSLQMGAINGESFWGGEYWRIVTSTLAHRDLPHIIFNSLALFYLGSRLEATAGKKWLVSVLVFSALIGKVMVLWLTPEVYTLGASGAICGVIGFFCFFYFSHQGRLPFAFIWPNILSIIALVAVAFLVPNISNSGHFGGFLGGLVVGFWYWLLKSEN